MKLALYVFILSLSVWGIRSPENKIVTVQTDNSNAVRDWLGVSGPLQFGNTSFSLAWSDKPNETYYVQEYLPRGENMDHFNQLLTVNLFDRPVGTEDAARQKVAELVERKKTDANCNYAVSRSKDGKEYVVDFILSQGAGNAAIIEFNIYRYKQIETADGKAALMVYAYSKRSYGDKITAFLTNLKAERSSLLQTVSTTQMPAVKIGDK